MIQNIVTTYLLSESTAEVSLGLDFPGIGYTSTSSASVDYHPILDDHRGPISGKAVGKNDQLHGKILRITSTITNTTTDDLDSGICIFMKGGLSARDYKAHQLLAPNESVTYHVEITLFQM